MANWEGVPDVAVRILNPHGETEWDYHEWITFGERVKANRLGVHNPRMVFARWTRWTCNNGTCPALAFVSDDGIKAMIEGAESVLR